MKRVSIFLLVQVLCSGTASASTPDADVRVLSSSDQALVFEYTPNFYEPSTLHDESRVYRHWMFEGAIDREDVGIGDPALSVRSFPLILPGLSGHTVEILSAEYESIQDVLLEPVPRVDGDFDDLEKTYVMGRAYTAAEFTPANIVEFRQRGVVRGYAMAEVQVSPLQFNPAARTLRKYSRILVRVNFGPPAYHVRPGDEDPLIKNLPLNYSTGKMWYAQAPSARSRYRSSVFKDGTWFRFSITEGGMYRLSGSALLAAGIPSSVNPRTIRIHSNGGVEPPDNPSVAYPTDISEIRIYLYDSEPLNVLNESDYIVFYGQGPRGWKYNPAQRSFHHTVNLYSDVAYYWVTFGGNQSTLMTPVTNLTDPAPFTPATVVGKVFREDERVNVQNSGRQWLGQSLNPNDAVTYLFPLPGIDLSQAVTYRFAVGARNTFTESRFVITEHGTIIATQAIPATSSHETGQYFSPYVVMRYVTASSFLPEPQSQLRLNYDSPSAGTGYIDWIDILYRRQLVADGNVFNFHSHDTAAVSSYSISGFSGGNAVWVFDVTRFDSVTYVRDPIVSGGQCTFQVQLTQGKVREYYVVGDNAFKAPGALQSFANQDVHGDTTAVDLIIITHKEFLPAAQRLKEHRERPGPDRLGVRIVDVEQIYNEFSGGYLSPVGIRNYLRYLNVAYSSTSAKYLLLFGDGDFDFRRITTPGANWVPVWATLESFEGVPLNSYATDDSLTIMAGSPAVQLGVGRLPVRSLAQAHDVVSKIIEYETLISPDPWKLRVTFVADDGFQEGITYASQSETLAGTTYLPPLFEVQKIYAAEYPLVTTSVGRRRPAANQAIVDVINRGTLVLNFIGHGNPRLWTHEQIFVRESDFPRLTNRGKYSLVIAATCNYSQYDHPFDQSGGEQLVVKAGAGAIASISASRPVFAGSNYDLVRTLYGYMFQLDSLGRVGRSRLGDIFWKTKQLHTAGLFENDKKFLLLGDPSVRFAIPRRIIKVDTLNRLPESATALFRALDTASVVGNVRDAGTDQLSNFSGISLVTVYDADRRIAINKPSENFVMTYSARGGVVFRGQSRIENGRLVSSFVIPKDISYDTTKPGRISLFFWDNNNTEDGAGMTRNFRVGSTNPSAPSDSIGPRISLYLDHRNFRPGDLVNDNPLLIADLYDEHGINTSNIGIGHSIEAWVDDKTESIDLSNFYTGKLDSYQEGTIEYALTGLTPGTHRLRLRAWDTYNNSSVKETNFDIGFSAGLRVYNVVNYPNPFTRSTTFTFQHNQLVPVDVEVKVYTVAGRIVESIEQRGIAETFVAVPWNGRDRDGDEVANGVYLYKIIVRTHDGRFTSETIGKLSKVR